MWLSFLFSLMGCTFFYLSSPNQIVLSSPLQPKIIRPLAWIFLLLAQILWMVFLDPKAGFFAALCIAMLLLGLLPLFFLLFQRKTS